MKYLVKDLSRLTGLSPARIRKWQERYSLLQPDVGTNGYHYYSSDDLFVLQRINRELERGEPLARIVERGREGILSGRIADGFSESDRENIALISQGKFTTLATHFDGQCQALGLAGALHGPMREMVHLVGSAWELGYLGVADEHAFSRWFSGYVEKLIDIYRPSDPPTWLVVTYPEDEHEIGALLHFCDLLQRGGSARFCGQLPERDLFRELAGHGYQKVSISVVLPRTERELASLRNRILARFPDISVLFGGVGYRARVSPVDDEI